jgi:hypothetical protein
MDPEPVGSAPTPLDTEAVAAALDGVERALERLEEGSYFVDEVTGNPLPDELLASDPTARRLPAS